MYGLAWSCNARQREEFALLIFMAELGTLRCGMATQAGAGIYSLFDFRGWLPLGCVRYGDAPRRTASSGVAP